MKTARKEELLNSFPAVPDKYMQKMKGRGANNFCIFLTYGKELFVRCYHRYSSGRIYERQRYVFAKDGAVRYICDIDSNKNPVNWKWTKNFREPVFYGNGSLYADNSYCIFNLEAVRKSDMKYCPIEKAGGLMICFLKLYVQHPNIEYLYKANYGHLVTKRIPYYSSQIHFSVPDNIEWKNNNLLKMLHLNRTEFKLLQGKETLYETYIWWRNEFPKSTPEQLISAAEKLGSYFGTANSLMKMTGYTVFRIVRYLTEQEISLTMYQDYLSQCNQLKYNLHDTAICFPKNFMKMHNRLTDIINALYEQNRKKQDKEKGRQIAKQIAKARKYREQMEFQFGGLILRQPASADEIVSEGKLLRHCVGGYVDRHLKAQTNIFFIRKRDAPTVPYFTIEVSNDFRILQCHGYRNERGTVKPQEIKDFEEQYKNYLEGLRNGGNHHQ